MKDFEREEIRDLPEKYRPLGAWAYFGYSFLFAIPLIGFILLIVFSFSDANIARRNYARSFFCGFMLVLIVLAVFFVIALAFGALASGRG